MESGRFLRAFLLRSLGLLLAGWALIALILSPPTAWLVVGSVSLVVLAVDMIWLTYRVRRDERRAAEE